MDFRVFAILPAAGCGERTGLDIPKQYCDVLGRPLIVYTLECFQRIPWVEKVLLVIASDREEYMKELVSRYKLTKVDLVHGGPDRHCSIQNGVKHLRDCVLERAEDGEPDREVGRRSTPLTEEEPVVIVHDATRPFADEDILLKVTLAAKKHRAAGAVLPLVSTILESDSHDVLVQSLTRSKFRESHTPQAFTWTTLEASYSKISEHDLEHGTEVLDLAFKHTGCRAKLVKAPDYVWKVTFKKDFMAAENFIKARSSEVYLLCSEPTLSDALKRLYDCLATRSLKVQTVSAIPDGVTSSHITALFHLVEPQQKEADIICKQNLNALVSKSASGGLLACVCSVSDDDDSTLMMTAR
ncbi:D-ribitol-5-phosphate cytidylyltransferase-like [Asterias amurensis]|uniref:D-ribitol-5-phosphate cytidylyltransferase-like n=1 Tax=Asterias amurensis TaxID=7602 RepID=UPI003AB84781